MDATTQRALNAINERFYASSAEAFDASRGAPWAGWERATSGLTADRPVSVLDIGCGNGRFACWLDGRWSDAITYLGIDASRALLDVARGRTANLPRTTARFEHADFVARSPDVALPHGRFDVVALFGVLHHVPGHPLRRALLEAALARARPGGLVLATFWQFADRARFERRRVPFEASGLGPEVLEDLEAGDQLLRFGDGDALRYCHFSDPTEIETLLRGLDADIVDRFEADGRSGDLNHYVVLRAAPVSA